MCTKKKEMMLYHHLFCFYVIGEITFYLIRVRSEYVFHTDRVCHE